ncbi:MAG: right-handed parallel beta-helix repeat-containing protein, partial [Desulfococcaceae bacterium]|nr:right-handed parallel beta-helix repeat-containing protein [Desulfococcaceae bacterium]
MKQRQWKKAAMVLTVIMLAVGFCVTGAQAGEPTPTTLYVNETGSDTSGDGTSGNPYATVTKAVSMANSGDIIDVTGTITDSGISIEGKNLTIRSTTGATVQAAATPETATDRVFSIVSATVEMNGLNIKNGKVADELGGGIYNLATLTMTGCTVSGNQAIGDYANGGGIYNLATLTMTGCTVSGNQATGSAHGGGIYNNNSGTLTMTDCTVSENQGSWGGGIRGDGSVTMTGCTVSDNQANLSSGGGVYGTFGTMLLTNCTFTGNTAYYGGGAVGYEEGGTVTLINCTVAENTATNSSKGDGIYISGSELILKNTIVANNDTSNFFVDGFTSQGYNLSDNWNSLTIDSTDITADPMLNELSACADGLPVYTLQADSPAIDAGTDTEAPLTDQCGQERSGTTDIGAWEYQGAASPPAAPTDLTATPVSGTQIDLSWTDNSSDETGFNIYQKGMLIGTADADATSYSDTGLTCERGYAYAVKAVNADGESDSATATATTGACASAANAAQML